MNRCRWIIALAMLVGLAAAAPARADNYPVRDATGTSQTFCSKLVAGLNYPCHLFFGLFGSTPTAVAVDASGDVQVNVQGALPLPTGASTSAAQTTANSSLSTIATNSGTAATAAKQPAPGTAGTPSSDVLTVQGATSMTPLLVRPSPTSSSASAIAPAGTTATNQSSLVLCASACNVYDFNVTALSVPGYLILIDAASAPSNGAITNVRACVPVNSAPSNGSGTYGSIPGRFTTGAVLLYSTTGCHTLTLSATAEMFGRAQ